MHIILIKVKIIRKKHRDIHLNKKNQDIIIFYVPGNYLGTEVSMVKIIKLLSSTDLESKWERERERKSPTTCLMTIFEQICSDLV